MTTDTPKTDLAPDANTQANPDRRPLSPEARRALAEAEARRAAESGRADPPAPEIGGRAGPDPVRYGDWENGGIASDF